MTKLINSVFLFSAVCLASACSTTGNVAPDAAQAEPAKSAQDGKRADAAKQPAASASQGAAVKAQSAQPAAADAADAKRRMHFSVYFDYDSNDIKPDQRPVVESHGQFLSKERALKTVIQGNTDERGSREYNLALGQRRAEALKKALGALGVRDNQVEAVSYGEEKPVAHGHDEAAWEQNRRADIQYPR